MAPPEDLRAFGLRAGSREESHSQCPLCHMRVEDCVVTYCRHVFCYDCLMTWFKEGMRQCPSCRTDVNEMIKQMGHEQAVANAVEVRPRGVEQRYGRDHGIPQRNAYGASFRPPRAPESRYATGEEIQEHRYSHPQVYQQRTFERSTITTHQPYSESIDRYPRDYRHEVAPPRKSHYGDPGPSHYREYSYGAEEELDPRDGLRTIGPNGTPMIRIDAHTLSQAVRTKFNTVADPHGIRRHPSYGRVASEVRRNWELMLYKRDGVKMYEADLICLFCDTMDIALDRAGVVSLRGGEDIPEAVDDFAKSVAKAVIREH